MGPRDREPLESRARAFLRAARDLIFGGPTISVVDRLVRDERRWGAFARAVEYANFEMIPGDIVEFGVWTGRSLALLATAHARDAKGMTRRLVGFDSFLGLPESAEVHARWRPGWCTSSGPHPLVPHGAPVTPQITRQLFAACGLPAPELEIGPFDETIGRVVPSKYPEIAIVHIDCDIYESTILALDGIAPALQDGAILLFDDWFHFKGNPARGEARAFHEFLSKHPEWGAVPFCPYATFANSFIVYLR